MNSVLELTARDNHKFSAYLAQPKEKPRAGLIIWCKQSYPRGN